MILIRANTLATSLIFIQKFLNKSITEIKNTHNERLDKKQNVHQSVLNYSSEEPLIRRWLWKLELICILQNQPSIL